MISSTFSGNTADNGGGLAVLSVYNAEISSSVFSGNRTTTGNGGGIYAENVTNLKLTSSTFSDNSSFYKGGALNAVSVNKIEISSSVFSENTSADKGGALSAVYVSDIEISSSVFSENLSAYEGGAFYVSDVANVKISSSVFSGNTANSGSGGSIYSDHVGTMDIIFSNISNNNSSHGGAIDSRYTKLNITSSVFSQNQALYEGGALYLPKEDVAEINSSVFSGNTANSGGAIYSTDITEIQITSSAFSGNFSTYRGGALYINGANSKATISSSTFSENESYSGGALYNIGTVILSSSVFSNNTALGVYSGGAIYNSGTLTIIESAFIDNTANGQKNDINNSGSLIFSGGGETSFTGGITGNGKAEINGGTSLFFDENAKLYQKELYISDDSEISVYSANLSVSDCIYNDGTLNLSGGRNTSVIKSTNSAGKLNITGDIDNMKEIQQKEMTITDSYFDNGKGAKIIIASTITLNGLSTLVTETKDLGISLQEIKLADDTSELILKDTDDCSLVTEITGSGKLSKTGSGTVELTKHNAYTGTTTISGGALKITDKENISENTIFMDGGKLIVSTNSVSGITLNNTIEAINGNNIKIETSSDTKLVLTQAINHSSTTDFIKTGDGTLKFEMDENLYGGNTIVEAGSLYGTTKNIKGVISGINGNFYFSDEAGDVVLNATDETGINSFVKTANSNSAMTVNKNFKAQTADIKSGTFIINNDASMGGSGTDFIVSDNMTVTDSVLKGYGNIKVGTLKIGQNATFAPGCSTTTFKIDGNIIFENNSNYEVELNQVNVDKANEETANDKIIVTGETTIRADAKITLNNVKGKYYIPETMTLIESGSLLSGTEIYKPDNIEFIDHDSDDLREGYETRISTKIYAEDGKLKIDLKRKASEYSTALDFKKSHNESESAKIIDSLSSGSTGDIVLSLNALEQFYYYKSTYDINAFKSALNDIAGVIHANSAMLPFTNAKIEHVYDKIKERTSVLDFYPCRKFHNKLWAEYYYNTYNVEKNENSPEFDTNVNGFLVGFDMISAKSWTMGIMAGYGTSTLKQKVNNDETTMNDINLGLYGGYENDKWLFKGMLLGGYEQYDTNRNILFMNRTAESEHNGYSAALDLEAGYKISLDEYGRNKRKMYLKPFAGITGTYTSQESFNEKGAEDLNLKVEDYSALNIQARLGLELNGKINKLGWYAKAGIRHLFTDDYAELNMSLDRFASAGEMKIRSAEFDKFSYGGGIGADYELSDFWTVFANGLVNLADKANNYYANIGVMYKFDCINRRQMRNKKGVEKVLKELLNILKNKKPTEAAMEKELKELNDDMEALIRNKKDVEDSIKSNLLKMKEENDALKKREKELEKRLLKYEAPVISKQNAEKMKAKTLKKIELKIKPTFVFGTDKLTKTGAKGLKQVIEEIKNYPSNSQILIEGHTDNIGSAEFNQALSEKRAASVSATLKFKYGIKNSIRIIGKGSQNPIDSNDTVKGREKNRRVEIIITAPYNDK